MVGAEVLVFSVLMYALAFHSWPPALASGVVFAALVTATELVQARLRRVGRRD